MDELIVLGVGHAVVKKCYNTCFALRKDDEYFLVDTGGGSQILTQLEKTNIPLTHIHHLFITHEHTDHLNGMVWIVRMISAMMKMNKYEGNLHIYAHSQLIVGIKAICNIMLSKQIQGLFDTRIIFHYLNDKDTYEILGESFTFFDILSTKAKQFGFVLNTNRYKLAFCGDEPYNEACSRHVKDSNILLLEAFCLYEHKDIYKPYEKHHSTALDAGRLAQELNVEHLILWHSEDDYLEHKKELYTKEASKYFKGTIHVPLDLERIEL